MNFFRRILAIFLLMAIPACGGNKDKGINRDKDKPKPIRAGQAASSSFRAQ